MSVILFLIGLIIAASGLLSLAGLTDFGMDYLYRTNLHQLSFLESFPDVWVYIVLGLALILIGFLITKQK